MSLAERLPSLDDKELATLRGNAVRLHETGAPAQKAQAADLLPLIDAELAERKARRPAPSAKPAKAPAKPRAKATKAKA